MAFGNLSKQAPRGDKIVPYVVRGLRNPDGSHPILHVEHLGEANRKFWLDVLARADVSDATVRSGKDRALRKAREENREDLIRFGVKRLENVFHDDGTPAGDGDIRGVVEALPDVDLDLLMLFVRNYDNFRDFTIASKPADLAEK